MLKQALTLVGIALAMAGCSAVDAPVEHRGISKLAMVNGTVSPSSQDSVVFIMKGQEESCSGTLIAPNLVLTARHCVATPSEDAECGPYSNTTSASNMSFKLGASAGWESGSTVAKGKKIFEPTSNNMCGFDVALVQLDRDVPNAKISPVRFKKLKNGEKTVTVGYGVDESDEELPKRMQRATTILGVGPAKVAYKMGDGKTFNYTAPDGDIVTGESTCFGDSGGPLFDDKGAVVAMTSRGPDNAPEGGIHGKNGCADMVSVFASTFLNKDLILNAAKTAGHPLVDDSATDPEPQSTKPDTKGDDDDNASGDDDDDDSVGDRGDDDDDKGDDDDDDSTSKTKPKKSTGSAPVAASGCSTTPGHNGNGSGLLVGLAVAFLALSRRKRAR